MTQRKSLSDLQRQLAVSQDWTRRLDPEQYKVTKFWHQTLGPVYRVEMVNAQDPGPTWYDATGKEIFYQQVYNWDKISSSQDQFIQRWYNMIQPQ